MTEPTESFIVPDTALPERADKAIAVYFPELTRSAAGRLLRLGLVKSDGRTARPSTIIGPGAKLEFLPEPETHPAAALPPPPDCRILMEDEYIIVLDKPAGLAVHPGAGTRTATLTDLLTATRPEMVGVGEEGRWGIVHRLDKDTSGVMVVAKTSEAHAFLSSLFREHSILRIYAAIVRGRPGADNGVINTPIGRHPKDRKRISVRTNKPRRAESHWRVIQRFESLSLLEIRPQTGRTHQIRVHLASIGLPVLGDQVYGMSGNKPPAGLSGRIEALLNRQALHAQELAFPHPSSKETVAFVSQMPEDMASVIRACGCETLP